MKQKPGLVTINAARKGKPEIAVGNVMGSNIFNSFTVMGIPGLIETLHTPANVYCLEMKKMIMY